jgi:hypothetical protein
MGTLQSLPSILIVQRHHLPLPYTRKLSAYVTFTNDDDDFLVNFKLRLGIALVWSVPWLSFFNVSLAADIFDACPAGRTHVSMFEFTNLYPLAHFEHCWLEAVLHVSVAVQAIMSVHFLHDPTGKPAFHVILP